MSVVRYYGREYDSSLFISWGWRGKVIIWLASVVAWLERYIERRLLKAIAFNNDVPREIELELEKAMADEDTQRRIRPVLDELLGNGIQLKDHERYKSRKNTPEQSYRDRRSDRSQRFFEVYTAPQRSIKYANRRDRRFADPDGNLVEVVGKAQGDLGAADGQKA
jgi:hypothetical protein